MCLVMGWKTPGSNGCPHLFLPVELAHRDCFRAREILGNVLRHFTRGGPFGSPLDGGNETSARHRVGGVSHYRCEHAALAVRDDPDGEYKTYLTENGIFNNY